MASMMRALALSALVLGGCPGGESLDPTCTPQDFNPATGVVADFGATDPAAQFEAFLSASASLSIAANSADTRLDAACTAIATDLGVDGAELEPADPAVPGAGATAACTRAAQAITETIEQNAPLGAALTITATPARCGVDLDAYADCVAECEVDVSGMATVECEPGMLSGTCTGQCSGSCTGACSAGCEGTCSGSCTGSCSGSCHGECSGACSLMNAQGECIGTCSGTCTGTCSGTCSGDCDATCDGACTASCEGECHGECDVMFEEPRCEGMVTTMASAECMTACDTRMELEVVCTPPEVIVELLVDLTPGQEPAIDALAATLQANLPEILLVSYQATTHMVDAGARLQASVNGLGAAFADVGAKAVTCAAVAVDAVADAVAAIDACVDVTVEISVSVMATGTVGP
jgi:hypothetical protein